MFFAAIKINLKKVKIKRQVIIVYFNSFWVSIPSDFLATTAKHLIYKKTE